MEVETSTAECMEHGGEESKSSSPNDTGTKSSGSLAGGEITLAPSNHSTKLGWVKVSRKRNHYQVARSKPLRYRRPHMTFFFQCEFQSGDTDDKTA